LKSAMSNMQDPNGLARFIDLVENPVDVFALSEEAAADFPLCFLRFAGKRATIRKLLQGVERIDELLEPFWSPDWRSLDHPIIDPVCVGLRRVSENDVVGHAFLGTPIQIASVASRDRLQRLRVRA